LSGFNSKVFDVREQELGEFMIRMLVFHKKSGFIWNFINVYGVAQDYHKFDFLVNYLCFAISANTLCWWVMTSTFSEKKLRKTSLGHEMEFSFQLYH
jgi:hypothetical protein